MPAKEKKNTAAKADKAAKKAAEQDAAFPQSKGKKGAAAGKGKK
jgi:hypothetical protein